MYHGVFIHLLTKGHLGYFQALAFVNKASVCRFSLDISFQMIWVNSTGHDYWIIWKEFGFVRNPQTVFVNACSLLHTHQQ